MNGIYYSYISPLVLKVDRSYQRGLEENRVKKIINSWDKLQVNPVKVSKREDGTFWILDGQHTVACWMLIEGSTEPIFCAVYEGLSERDEADLFFKMNTNHKNPSYGEKLYALSASGDEGANKYYEMLNRIGVPYSNNKGKNHNRLVCHGAVVRLIKTYGEKDVEDALSIIKECVVGQSKYNENIVKAFTCFIHYFKCADMGRLRKILEKCTSDSINEGIASFKKALGKGTDGALSEKYGALYLQCLYNKRLPDSKKLDSSNIVIGG